MVGQSLIPYISHTGGQRVLDRTSRRPSCVDVAITHIERRAWSSRWIAQCDYRQSVISIGPLERMLKRQSAMGVAGWCYRRHQLCLTDGIYNPTWTPSSVALHGRSPLFCFAYLASHKCGMPTHLVLKSELLLVSSVVSRSRDFEGSWDCCLYVGSAPAPQGFLSLLLAVLLLTSLSPSHCLFLSQQ